MKIHFIKINTVPGELLIATEVKERKFSAPLHYHPELELTLILESSGKRFIGDSIQNFEPDDLVLVGENLPHFWRNDSNLLKDGFSRAIVVQFNKSFLGESFFTLNGANHINRLIKNSTRGVCFRDPITKALIKDKLIRLLELDTFEKALGLLEILNILAKSDICYLSSPEYKAHFNEIDCTRLNKVFNYVYNNINSSFEISEIADLLNMSVSAFCHYFKKRTQKTFMQFINETRIGKAKRLLIETDKSIAEIAYESGYNSLSNFNKQFNSLEKLSPKLFRKKYYDYANDLPDVPEHLEYDS
ncbi:AraC family transcriptional regulator [Solitalea koreensis]|uniref:Transcriptional regulator, AraC family n=1 Tax=Solitalea koreensis TaxID=543615 RepID=A0A521BQR6_9SPHI|nr:AraC family transcriptional regulator [Solitalea koreensis]SMO49514.1 transcriptional regulator, AraC family [Solitalea koreensis]